MKARLASPTPVPGSGSSRSHGGPLANGVPATVHPVARHPDGLCERILRASNVCCMGFSPTGLLIFFNDAARSWIWRYFEVELETGLRVDDIFEPAHNDEFNECLALAVQGEAQQFHCCFVVGGVEERRFQVQFLPMPGESGAGGLIEIIQVASRIVLSKSIIDQDELFRHLVQNSSDVMALLEEDGSIRYLSPSAEAVLGFPVDVMIGKNARHLIHPDDLRHILGQDSVNAFQPGAQIALCYRFQHADGRWIHLESVATNLLHHPAIKGFVVNTRDVTERRMAEQVLAMEKEWLSVTLRSIGDAVITTDLDGHVTMINKTAEKLTGYSQAEAESRPLADIYHIMDPDSGRRVPMPLADMMARAGEGNQIEAPVEQECLLASRDGGQRLVDHSAALIRDLEGKVIGMVVVFRDMTDRQRLAEEMDRASRLESVGMLAGGIAHDFNNILLAIINNVSLARTRLADEPEIHSRLEDAERASLKARDLTRQLLTFSKGGAPVLNTHQLQGIIRESTEFVLHGSNIELRFDLPEDLSPVDVDAGQISQVLNNLAINAMQAMPEGGRIEVSAENVALDGENRYSLAAGDYVRIRIADTGPGIPRQHLTKLFDPFFTTKPSGSGLGLATSYSILRSHNGSISAESREGEGAVFHILLPVSANPEMIEEVAEIAPVRGEGRIALMDDESDIRLTLPLLIEEYGYQIDAYPDGQSLLDGYRRAAEEGRPYSLAIMDLTIPGGMGGREAVARLKDFDPGARAIVSSGYSNDSTMAEYRKFGFDGVVSKPFRIEELVRVIQRVLD